MENTEYRLINKETGERLSAPLHQERMIHTFNHNQFGEIRMIMRNGEPWFVGKDVCEKLSYSNGRKAINDHVTKSDTVIYGIVGGDNRTRETTLINESGLYSLIMRSKKPDAQKFQRWVTSEVLPSIRKTGSYSVQQTSVDTLQMFELQLQVMKEQSEAIKKIEFQTHQNTEQIQDALSHITLNTKKVQNLANLLKLKLNQLYGFKVTASDAVYKDARKKLFNKYRVRRWEEIPVSEYYAVHADIDGLDDEGSIEF